MTSALHWRLRPLRMQNICCADVAEDGEAEMEEGEAGEEPEAEGGEDGEYEGAIQTRCLHTLPCVLNTADAKSRGDGEYEGAVCNALHAS